MGQFLLLLLHQHVSLFRLSAAFLLHRHRCGRGTSFDQCLARAILFRPTLAEERTILAIGDVVITMANIGTDLTDAHLIDHLAGVTVIPMLAGVFLLRRRVGAQLVRIVFG